MSTTGYAVGLNKGHKVEKRTQAPRPSHAKAVSNLI